MFVVGLTSSMGCGASTVAKMLKKKGFEVIEADRVSHTIFRPNSLAWREAVRVFGKQIIGRNNEISHSALASVAFESKESVARLNKIAHPLIIKEIKNKIARLEKAGKKVVVLDAPLLLEAKMRKMVDFLVVVAAEKKLCIRRIVRRDFFYPEEAVKRINVQMPLEKKVEVADFVIDNNGTISETRRQVGKIALKLKKMAKKNG